MSARLLSLAVLIVLSGCAAPRAYEWNDYDTRLYRLYKDPTTADQFRVSLQTQLDALEARNVRPPPGLYAELGTFYLERGENATALVYYKKERDAWRESKYLMDTMISAIEKRTKPGAPK